MILILVIPPVHSHSYLCCSKPPRLLDFCWCLCKRLQESGIALVSMFQKCTWTLTGSNVCQDLVNCDDCYAIFVKVVIVWVVVRVIIVMLFSIETIWLFFSSDVDIPAVAASDDKSSTLLSPGFGFIRFFDLRQTFPRARQFWR